MGYSATAGAPDEAEWKIKQIWCDKKHLSVGDIMQIEYAPTRYRIISISEPRSEQSHNGSWNPSYRLAVLLNLETGKRVNRTLTGVGMRFPVVGGDKLAMANRDPSLVRQHYERWQWRGGNDFNGIEPRVPKGQDAGWEQSDAGLA